MACSFILVYQLCFVQNKKKSYKKTCLSYSFSECIITTVQVLQQDINNLILNIFLISLYHVQVVQEKLNL